MGSGASSDSSKAETKGTRVSTTNPEDLLKVSLDRPEYNNGKPDLSYQDAQGNTVKVNVLPEEVIGCFTTLDKAGRVTSAPGRLFRLVLPAATAAEKVRAASSGSTSSDLAAGGATTTTNTGTAATTAAAAVNEENEEEDARSRRWFFYNDTKEYNMVVTAYFGAYSQLRVMGVAAKMWRELPSGLVIAELVVPPLKTLPFVEGLITDGYDLRFKALKAD